MLICYFGVIYKTTKNSIPNNFLTNFSVYAKINHCYCSHNCAIIYADETVDIEFSGSFDGNDGASYAVGLYQDIDSSLEAIGAAQTFTVNNIYTGISQVESAEAGVSLSPNPTADVVRIDSDADMGDITIYSISGKQVLNINAGGSRSLTLQIEVLPAGVYVVKIATNQGEEVRRLIKK